MERTIRKNKYEPISKRYVIREPYLLQGGLIGRDYCFQLLYGDKVVVSVEYRSIPAQNVLLGWIDHNLTVDLNTYLTLVAIQSVIKDLEEHNAKEYTR